MLAQLERDAFGQLRSQREIAARVMKGSSAECRMSVGNADSMQVLATARLAVVVGRVREAVQRRCNAPIETFEVERREAARRSNGAGRC